MVLRRYFATDNAYLLLPVCLAGAVQMHLQLSLVEQMNMNVLKAPVLVTCERSWIASFLLNFICYLLIGYNSKVDVSVL